MASCRDAERRHMDLQAASRKPNAGSIHCYHTEHGTAMRYRSANRGLLWSVAGGFMRAIRHPAARALQALEDLRALPGNRLEALRGDRAGQYSIRVNM
jgi:hypothetical protein